MSSSDQKLSVSQVIHLCLYRPWQDSFDGDSFVSQSRFDAYAGRGGSQRTLKNYKHHFWYFCCLLDISLLIFSYKSSFSMLS